MTNEELAQRLERLEEAVMHGAEFSSIVVGPKGRKFTRSAAELWLGLSDGVRRRAIAALAENSAAFIATRDVRAAALAETDERAETPKKENAR